MDAVAFAIIDALPATAPTVGWQTIGTLAEPRAGSAVSTDGTRIYISHGQNSGSTAAGNDTFTPGVGRVPATAATVARQGVAGAFCNGKHYAIGGKLSNGTATATVEAYTPAGTNGASGVWTTAAAFPDSNGRAYCSTAVVGNFAYVAGGELGGGTSSAQPSLYRYDTVNNVWATLASMPAARTQGAMVAVGTKLYYLGGIDSSGTSTTTVYAFDTTAGTWSTPGWVANIPTQPNIATVISGSAYYLSGASLRALNLTTGAETVAGPAPTAHGNQWGWVSLSSVIYDVSGTGTANVDKLDLGAGTGYTTAVLGVRSLLNPVLTGVGSTLPVTPPTDTAGKAAYAQTVQTLKSLAAL